MFDAYRNSPAASRLGDDRNCNLEEFAAVRKSSVSAPVQGRYHVKNPEKQSPETQLLGYNNETMGSQN